MLRKRSTRQPGDSDTTMSTGTVKLIDHKAEEPQDIGPLVSSEFQLLQLKNAIIQ
jgi:hypothetical protein